MELIRIELNKVQEDRRILRARVGELEYDLLKEAGLGVEAHCRIKELEAALRAVSEFFGESVRYQPGLLQGLRPLLEQVEVALATDAARPSEASRASTPETPRPPDASEPPRQP